MYVYASEINGYLLSDYPTVHLSIMVLTKVFINILYKISLNSFSLFVPVCAFGKSLGLVVAYFSDLNELGNQTN